MPLVLLFLLKLALILLDGLDDVKYLLGEAFLLVLFCVAVLAVLGFERRGYYHPGLEFVGTHFFSVFSGLNSIVLHVLYRDDLLLALLPTDILLVQQLDVVLYPLRNDPPHQHPGVRSKWDVPLFGRAVVEPSRGLDGVAVRHVSQDDCPSRGFFELGYPENATIVPEHISLVGQYLRKYPRLVVIRLPNLILGAIQKHVLLH